MFLYIIIYLNILTILLNLLTDVVILVIKIGECCFCERLLYIGQRSSWLI